MYYDMEGRPIDLYRWLELYDKRRGLAKTQVGPYLVSTIYEGVDHGFGLTLLPIIFETGLLRKEWKGYGFVEVIDRYATKGGAMRGHYRYIQELKRYIAKKKRMKAMYHQRRR